MYTCCVRVIQYTYSVLLSAVYVAMTVSLWVHVIEWRGSDDELQLNVTVSPSMISWLLGELIITGPAIGKYVHSEFKETIKSKRVTYLTLQLLTHIHAHIHIHIHLHVYIHIYILRSQYIGMSFDTYLTLHNLHVHYTIIIYIEANIVVCHLSKISA